MTQQGGFAGAVGTGDNREFSLVKGEADVVERLGAVGKAMRKVGGFDDGHGFIRQPLRRQKCRP